MNRILIVNADDFGRSAGINRGVVRGHTDGIVTSASAMVRWSAAKEAAVIASAHPALSVGLHLDLAEWVYTEGEWRLVYEVVSREAASVVRELERQLERFRVLFGREPTHLDSHQHVHRDEPVRSILVETGRRLGIPVRDCTPEIQYRGGFYGQTGKGEPLPDEISVESLLRILRSLEAGVTELSCHPAAEPERESAYAAERPDELRALCDLRVRHAVCERGIELRSFSDARSLLAERRACSDRSRHLRAPNR